MPTKPPSVPRELAELLEKGRARKLSSDGGMRTRTKAVNDLGAPPARERKPTTFADEFRVWVASLERSKRSTWGRETAEFADEIGCRLAELDSKVDDPETGTKLVAAFLATSESVYARCDDSNGDLQDVYEGDGAELFVGYASRWNGKDEVARLAERIFFGDSHGGIGQAIFGKAVAFLPGSDVLRMAERVEEAAGRPGNEREMWRLCAGVETLARTLGEIDIFARNRIRRAGKNPSAAFVDIAEVCLEAGDAGRALSWLTRVPGDGWESCRRDELLLDAYRVLGDVSKQTEVAWRIFKRDRCRDAFDGLIAVIGDGEREAVLSAEAVGILADPQFVVTDAVFLADTGRWDDAEDYLVTRAGQVDGGHYSLLQPLAEALISASRPLAATVVYRALLESILRKARSKAYYYGAQYLVVLGDLAAEVADWRGIKSHEPWAEALGRTHSRKSAFWAAVREQMDKDESS